MNNQEALYRTLSSQDFTRQLAITSKIAAQIAPILRQCQNLQFMAHYDPQQVAQLVRVAQELKPVLDRLNALGLPNSTYVHSPTRGPNDLTIQTPTLHREEPIEEMDLDSLTDFVYGQIRQFWELFFRFLIIYSVLQPTLDLPTIPEAIEKIFHETVTQDDVDPQAKRTQRFVPNLKEAEAYDGKAPTNNKGPSNGDSDGVAICGANGLRARKSKKKTDAP